VGITGLNPSTGWPEGEGLASKTIGTATGLPRRTFVPVDALSAHEGRLATVLGRLFTAGHVHVLIDGTAITAASQITQVGTVDGLEHNGSVSVPVHDLEGISGAWTLAYDAAAHLFYSERTAAATTDSAALDIPAVALRDASGSGRRPTGLTLYYRVATADLDDVSVVAYKTNTPADGTVVAASSMSTAQTFDAAHDTAAERGDFGAGPKQHTMDITFAAAQQVYFNDGEGMHLEITVDGDAGAAGVFRLYKVVLHYKERLAVPNA
jgi:hypothetical protein